MLGNLAAIIGGLFCLCAAFFDWDFFFDNYRARPFSKIFGGNGARAFYAVIGVLLILLGSIFLR